jgi:hypothetical protein
MKLQRVTLCIVAALAVQPLMGQRGVLREDDNGKVLDRFEWIGQDASSYAKVKAMALEFSTRYGSKRRMFRLTVGDTWQTVSRSIGHGVVDGDNYRLAILSIRDRGMPKGPIGRVFGVDGNVLLTYRNGDEIREELLAGQVDPTLFDSGNARYRVLHISVTKVGGTIGPHPEYAIHVFAMALTGLSTRASEAFVRRISVLTSCETVSVSVRPDIWFLDDGQYPDVFPFAKAPVVPGETEFESVPYHICGLDSKRGPVCGVSPSPPPKPPTTSPRPPAKSPK